MSARLFLPGHAARRTRAKAEADRRFTMSPDLIVVAGFDGYFNPAFVARLGYTNQEALTRPYLEFVHPDDRERTKSRRNEIVEAEATVSFENRYVCKVGSYGGSSGRQRLCSRNG